ncbi:gliding motility-associated C-terminal domain-containing protein, partial [Ekhidna sp.]
FNNGDAGASEVAGLAPDTYYLQITNTAAANGTGCTQPAADFIEFIIEDETVNPIINLATSIIEDTFCDNTGNVGDGEISISIVDEGVAATSADYTITWYRGAVLAANEIYPVDGGTRGSATINATSTILSDLATGDYSVVVTKDLGDTPVTGNEGCTATAAFNVGSMDNIPTIDVVAIQARTEPDTLCVGNSGTLIINDVDVSSSDLTDFEIRIFTGAVGVGELVGSPYTNIAATSISYTDLAANDYFITAENTTTGCLAATAIINVKDSVRNPVVTLVSVKPDENCGGPNSVGGLEVLVDGIYDHTNQAFLTFLWIDVASGNDVNTEFGVTENEAVLAGVPAGDYTVTVTNTNTSCFITRTYSVPNEPVFPSITNSEVNNKTFCFDNGSFVLLEIIQDGITFDEAAMDAGDFTLEVFTDPGNVSQGTVSTSPYEITGLAAGDFYAVATNNDSGCPSANVDFTIADNPFFPEILITIDAADSTCAPGSTPNGTLSALADGQDHTNPDYTFQWYFGAAADIGGSAVLLTGVPLANGSVPVGFDEGTISGLAAGLYSVEVSQASSGCTSTAQITVPNVPIEVEIISVDVTNATNCTPANGIIDVTAVERSNNPDNLADYSFAFYDENPNNAGATPVFTVPTDGAVFNQASGGTTYFIVGTNTVINCTTPIFQVEVGDDSSFPEVANVESTQQTNCDPANPNGTMTILIDDPLTIVFDEIIPSAPDYTVQWYFGTGTANTLDDADIGSFGTLTGETTATVSGLPAGTYTFEVTNTGTGCSVVETVTLPDEERTDYPLRLSKEDNKSCLAPDGSVTASVIFGQNQNYDFYWYNGIVSAPDSTIADFTGNSQEGLPSGDYTVLVVEKSDRFCQSVDNISVLDQNNTNALNYDLITQNVTVCFDTKDGYAEVVLRGSDSLRSISIQWFDPLGALIGNANTINDLDAGAYRLVLTDAVTGCTTTEIFDILDESVQPNDPFVLVNNGRNNCSFANGSALANVDGVTNNFLFEWFDPLDMSNPYATGSEVFNLDTTTYLVRATNLSTGCTSGFTPVEIGYEVIDPEFEVEFNNSVCLRTEDGATNQFTGTAIIRFAEFNLATEYEWRDESGTVVGNESRLIDAYPGNYTVTFTAENGCTYESSFSIETSLTIYNGVSANSDGKNDFFLIDCIDYFPNNNVKIFNRAGQRIYESDGYDNTSTRFEGFSNVGNGGLKLPPGTYFYIVELGNGEEPVQGFVELVR